MRDIRPLDRFASIKIKLGVLVGSASTVCALAVWWGLHTGLATRYTLPLSVLLALVVTQLLARGMTSPLREMTAAAVSMSRGDYSRRVRATSNDEVGELARRVQPHGRGPGLGRPPAPRAGRQRQPRAAHARVRPAGGAGEHRRRRDRAGPGHAADGAAADRAAGRSRRAAARPVPDRGRRHVDAAGPRAAAGVPRRLPGRGGDVRPAGALRRTGRPAGPHRPGRPRAPAPGARQPGRQRHPALPRGRHRLAARPRRRDRHRARRRRRGAGHRPGGPGPRVRAVPPRRPGAQRRRHRPRPGHRPLGRRPARRHDPGRRHPGRLPDPGRPAPPALDRARPGRRPGSRA